MLHKIDDISIWSPSQIYDDNNHNYKRRILTFRFCDTEKGSSLFKNTPVFRRIQDVNMFDLVSNRPSLTYLVDKTHVLTTKDLLPLDLRHHDDVLANIKHFIQCTINTNFWLSSNIPKEIVAIILGYCMDINREFLRDKNCMD